MARALHPAGQPRGAQDEKPDAALAAGKDAASDAGAADGKGATAH